MTRGQKESPLPESSKVTSNLAFVKGLFNKLHDKSNREIINIGYIVFSSFRFWFITNMWRNTPQSCILLPYLATLFLQLHFNNGR